jgi:hypothetical protein
MSKKVLLGTLVLAAMFTAVSFPSGVGAQNAGWHARGSGKAPGRGGVIVFNAVSSPGGANAKGDWYIRQAYGGTMIEERGPVTCLNVVGNTAMLGILITDSTNPTRPVGSFYYAWVQDNSNANNTPDYWDVSVNTTASSVCPAPPAPGTPFAGDILVQN